MLLPPLYRDFAAQIIEICTQKSRKLHQVEPEHAPILLSYHLGSLQIRVLSDGFLGLPREIYALITLVDNRVGADGLDPSPVEILPVAARCICSTAGVLNVMRRLE